MELREAVNNMYREREDKIDALAWSEFHKQLCGNIDHLFPKDTSMDEKNIVEIMPGIWTSIKTDLLNTAMALFMADGIVIKKSGLNTGFKPVGHPEGAPYTTIDDLNDPVVKKGLAKHGLVLSYYPMGGLEKAVVLTEISHTSGQFKIVRSEASPVNKNIHGIMAATTYLKRNAGCSILGATDTPDDDGNEAAGKVKSDLTGSGTANSSGYTVGTMLLDAKQWDNNADVYTGTKEQKIELAKIFLETGVAGQSDQKGVSKRAIDEKVLMKNLKHWVSQL